MQVQGEHPAGHAAAEGIGSEREFMDALRALRVRSGLSYRDVAVRMAQSAPRDAMAKSTLASLFAQDALPRRPRQLTAIVDVLTAELAEPAEPAEVSAGYLAAWTRLMTARSAHPGPPAEPLPASPPPAPRPPPPAPRPLPSVIPRRARSDFAQAGGLWPVLIGCTVLSLITWLPFRDGPVPFWGIWLAWCGPVLALTAISRLSGQPHESRSPELNAEYTRYGQRSAPRWPSRF